MTLGEAIDAMHAGHRVSRSGWNGKGMWVAIQGGSTITSDQARGGAAIWRAKDAPGQDIKILPHIDMCNADGDIVIGWLANQTDMLADDWGIVE